MVPEGQRDTESFWWFFVLFSCFLVFWPETHPTVGVAPSSSNDPDRLTSSREEIPFSMILSLA